MADHTHVCYLLFSRNTFVVTLLGLSLLNVVCYVESKYNFNRNRRPTGRFDRSSNLLLLEPARRNMEFKTKLRKPKLKPKLFRNIKEHLLEISDTGLDQDDVFQEVRRKMLPDGRVKIKYRHLYGGVKVIDSKIVVFLENEKLMKSRGRLARNIRKSILGRRQKIKEKAALRRCKQGMKVVGFPRLKFIYAMTSRGTTDKIIIVDMLALLKKRHNADVPPILQNCGFNRFICRVNTFTGEVKLTEAGMLNTVEEEACTTNDVLIGNEKRFYSLKLTELISYKKKYFPITRTTCETCNAYNDHIEVVNLNNDYDPTAITTAFTFSCLSPSDAINGGHSPVGDCLYYGTQVIEMFKHWFGRTNFWRSENSTERLKFRCHYGTMEENALFDGQHFIFGNGADNLFPLCSCPEIVAHEIAHGYTEYYGGNLFYGGQSGGVGESFADICGIVFQKYVLDILDWRFGYPCMKNMLALRLLNDPPADCDDSYSLDYKEKYCSIDHIDAYSDLKDVHASSGVFNKAFYILASLSNWGVKKSFEVFLEANDWYWFEESDFEDAACGCFYAAEDLGYSATDVEAAFAQVGLTSLSTKCEVPQVCGNSTGLYAVESSTIIFKTIFLPSGGIIALLDEPESEIKSFALAKLNQIVDVFWAEIADAVNQIEILYEDETFKDRELAALVASKVYYHLGAFEESVNFALGSGKHFDVNSSNQYVETIIAKCIDQYTKLRCTSPLDDKVTIDERLEAVVNQMFKRCFDDAQYKQAVGIALETRRLDIFRKAIAESNDVPGMLAYSLRVCMTLIENRQFRHDVLRELVELYLALQIPDFISVVQCMIFLDEPQDVADILQKRVKESEENALMAYQIAFDLYDTASQQFVSAVRAAIGFSEVAPSPSTSTVSPQPTSSAAPSTPAVSTFTAKSAEPETATDSVPMETDEEGLTSCDQPAPAEPPVDPPPSTISPETRTESSKTASSSGAVEAPKETDEDREVKSRMNKLATILSGDLTIDLQMQFLIRNNKSDMLILKNTKEQVRNSVTHNATIICNGYMYYGTTSDQFLRDNLEWLSRATNWAKFTATASLGLIHHGHEKEALKLMEAYLPKDSGPGSAYSEGGGLYALGLIHANHGSAILEYLLGQLKNATTDVIRHGACLGLGLAAMGTERSDVYEQLKLNLYQDDAVTGEAAGIGMGLVMLGRNSPVAIEDMMTYAQETQHEKILRGLAVGIALNMYGRMEEADPLIESLCRDKDPILRWAGMYTIAMAYCGSGNNSAIRRLLHVAVSDVKDDVRRVAVLSLGFLLFKMPDQCPGIVSLLTESYNPHVRYGAAMALGIACAGTGLKEALNLLEPLLNDPVNYVRQGTLIASAMILIQQNEITCPKVATFRQQFSKMQSDKHEDVMAKFGAILAQGIIDAGGRNVTISLQSSSGHTNMAAVVGMLVFQQFWYWFPLSHFIGLCFSPTCLIALNSQLKMPKLNFRSNCRPSTFAYPPPLEEKKDKSKEKVETAVLSITAKQKKRDEAKKGSKMDVDESKESLSVKDSKASTTATETKPKTISKITTTTSKQATSTSAASVSADTPSTGEIKQEKKEPEPNFHMLDNPARVMSAQLKCIVMGNEYSATYKSLKEVSSGGIILVKNLKPGEREALVEPVLASGPIAASDDGPEPEPPEPFEYIED